MKDLKREKPKDGETIRIGVDANPMIVKYAVYKNGKFYDVDDNKFELFPTHWEY